MIVHCSGTLHLSISCFVPMPCCICRPENGAERLQPLPQVEKLAPASPQGLQWKETSRKLHMPTPSPHPPLRTPAPGVTLPDSCTYTLMLPMYCFLHGLQW